MLDEIGTAATCRYGERGTTEPATQSAMSMDGEAVCDGDCNLPDDLWRSTRMGREQVIQRALSTLIIGHCNFRGNRPEPPCRRGVTFLTELMANAFDLELPVGIEFIEELELPRRHDDEMSGYPDHAIIAAGLLVLIELKTETSSQRRGQLRHYATLAAHHYCEPGQAIHLLYVTPPMDVPHLQALPDGVRFVHLTWAPVSDLLEQIWGDECERAVQLSRWLRRVHNQEPSPSRAESGESPAADEELQELGPFAQAVINLALREAARVQTTGVQSAVDLWLGDPEHLELLRLLLRRRLEPGLCFENAGLTHVRPWLWNEATSGGDPLTAAGASYGYELRLSRYQEQQWPDPPDC